ALVSKRWTERSTDLLREHVHGKKFASAGWKVSGVAEFARSQFEFAAGGGVKPGIENPVGNCSGGSAVGMAIGTFPVANGMAVGNENTGVLGALAAGEPEFAPPAGVEPE